MKTNASESRGKLPAKCAELLERLNAIKRDVNGLDRDMDEQAVQLENAEALEALNRQALKELEAIKKVTAPVEALS